MGAAVACVTGAAVGCAIVAAGVGGSGVAGAEHAANARAKRMNRIPLNIIVRDILFLREMDLEFDAMPSCDTALKNKNALAVPFCFGKTKAHITFK